MAPLRPLIVRYTPFAIEQFDAISDYLRSRSPQGFEAVARALSQAVANIAEHPYLGHSGRTPGVRIKPVAGRPYIIVYEVHDEADTIAILGIFHAAQNRDEGMK